MNYDLIRNICRMNKISIRSICDEIGISMDGLKRGVESGGLGIRHVIPLCKALCITPNRLFGWEDLQESTLPITVNQNQVGGSGNMQMAGLDSTEVLKLQLQEKDSQISRLLGILEKNNIPL